MINKSLNCISKSEIKSFVMYEFVLIRKLFIEHVKNKN